MFLLGGSSGEDDSSLEEHMQPYSRLSSLSDGLKRPMQCKKQTSFKDEVITRTINERTEDDEVFSEEDEDVVSESAIEDDDSSDWEDSNDDSGRSSVDEKHLFQRVDSRPNLTSRRSLITTLLHEPERAAALANAASRSTPAMPRSSRTTTPNGPSVAASPEEESTLMMRGPERDIPRSKPIGMNPLSLQPVALSPRTTRRNMLATELTESLRKHLLWERQQKVHGGAQVQAAMKRRHTSQDMRNLQEYPQRAFMKSSLKSQNNSWNAYFDQGLGEYHARGW
jgi:hypothetical protein